VDTMLQIEGETDRQAKKSHPRVAFSHHFA